MGGDQGTDRVRGGGTGKGSQRGDAACVAAARRTTRGQGGAAASTEREGSGERRSGGNRGTQEGAVQRGKRRDKGGAEARVRGGGGEGVQGRRAARRKSVEGKESPRVQQDGATLASARGGGGNHTPRRQPRDRERCARGAEAQPDAVKSTHRVGSPGAAGTVVGRSRQLPPRTAGRRRPTGPRARHRGGNQPGGGRRDGQTRARSAVAASRGPRPPARSRCAACGAPPATNRSATFALAAAGWPPRVAAATGPPQGAHTRSDWPPPQLRWKPNGATPRGGRRDAVCRSAQPL